MHELGIAMEILRTCEEVLEREGPGRIESVKVEVGELSSVEPDLLGFAWEAAVHATPHKGARMEIVWRPARQACVACGGDKPRGRGEWHLACPDCHGPLGLEGGRELGVLELTFDPVHDESAEEGTGE
jgi:hydrogenase nickel incorporation protein HypA/HybF